MVYNHNSAKKEQARHLLIALVITLLPFVTPGCRPSSRSQVKYENPEWNFGLEYPNNWEFNDNDRVANDFSLKVTQGVFERSSVLILIVAGLPVPEEPPSSLEETLKNYLSSLTKRTHVFRSFEVVEMTDVIHNGHHEMIKATVSIPTLDIVEGSSINQIGEVSEDVLQTLEINILRNSQGQNLVVEVYPGTNKVLNAQAEEIVQSLGFLEE